MLHVKAFAKSPAGNRSCDVEIFMQPQCNLQDHFVHVVTAAAQAVMAQPIYGGHAPRAVIQMEQ